MKTNLFLLVLIISLPVVFLSCKKESRNSKTVASSDLPQKISTALNGSDSLTRFAGLFKLLAVENTALSKGATVLALTNDALINPCDPNNLKDYIINGIIPATELKNGKILTSITGKQIAITEQGGKVFANGSQIEV